MVAIVVVLGLPACFETRMFRIDFPDTAFVVEEDWVAPNERAQNLTSFVVRIPRSRVPRQSLQLESELPGYQLDAHLKPATYNVHLDYQGTPKPGAPLRKLLQAGGWVLLPDTDPEFRIAVRHDAGQSSLPRREAYEPKADTRYLITCSTYRMGSDPARRFRQCAMTAPYREPFSGEMSVQIAVGVPQEHLRRWAEFAEAERTAIRQFQVESDPRIWQRREQMRRDALRATEPKPTSVKGGA
ncbi:hypothetical protein LZ009_11225 [Ramlibacter sp. XY19]|uniref:hypothetical protein n=1 Tax=Ramlibacter paludis TaxID=2908000 RepID=UPI0023DB337C|nr:hypothetical protein [Ramlibacter paludis]MCG2593348.1 hypothetical protein [Ramlibacter paludis]